ncbi:hypothetical protein MOQ_010331 [Trypanosoma cruzi marinkellei]|uniref:Ubiquitin-like domain-containing protein n=1 Tax=Trypanosoma cruzi marinkellei TaxID=85056 RepID=K2MUE5_TRYCR|nr:hypothetical protein MOQ_010331 [Trypanosoma cruzi marinkellei]
MFINSAASRQMIRVQIRSLRGETMDVEVPRECTVGQLREFLIGYYGYPPATSLVYGNYVVGDERLVEEFPFGSLFLVTPLDGAQRGYPAQQQQIETPQPRGERFYNKQRQPQQRSQNQGHGNLQQPKREPFNPLFPVGDKKQQQQQKEDDRSGFDSREPKKESAASVSKAFHSRTHSNSMASSGTRSPPVGNDNKQPGCPGENLRSFSCQSSSSSPPPPQRSPHDTVPSGTTSPSKFVRNNLPPTAPVESSGDGKDSLDRMPRNKAPGTPSTDASRTPRDTNIEATRGVSEDAGDTASVAPRISVKCMVPALKKSINLELPGDATLGDLLLEVVSQEPRLAGSKVVFRGKLLSGSDAKLNAYGIHADAPPSSLSLTNPDASGVYTLFFASGEYSDPQKVMLVEIEADTACIESIIKGGELTIQQRRGYYEELMRILFRTDNLQELEGEWRSRRKDAVMRVTRIQDLLNVDVSS